MITIEQCRAARGLLGWTQQDLAKASGLSKTAINNFEKGNSDIKQDSLRSIQLAFESLDIEFIGHEGIKRRNNHAEIITGPNCYLDLIDDITTTLRKHGNQLLIFNPNNRLTHDNVVNNINSLIERLKNEFSINTRILYLQENILPITAPHEKKITLNPLSNHLPIGFIYGDKLSLQLGISPFITIINSPQQHQEQKQIFENLWQSANASPEQETTKRAYK